MRQAPQAAVKRTYKQLKELINPLSSFSLIFIKPKAHKLEHKKQHSLSRPASEGGHMLLATTNTNDERPGAVKFLTKANGTATSTNNAEFTYDFVS